MIKKEVDKIRRLLVVTLLFVLTLSFICAMPIYVQPLDGNVGVGNNYKGGLSNILDLSL